MSTVVAYPHVQIGADGVARIANTRYKVQHLAAEHYAYGWTAEELLRQHPDLRPQDVYASLVYFYDHFSDMVAQMQTTSDGIETKRREQSLSRDELLNRRLTGDA